MLLSFNTASYLITRIQKYKVRRSFSENCCSLGILAAGHSLESWSKWWLCKAGKATHILMSKTPGTGCLRNVRMRKWLAFIIYYYYYYYSSYVNVRFVTCLILFCEFMIFCPFHLFSFRFLNFCFVDIFLNRESGGRWLLTDEVSLASWEYSCYKTENNNQYIP